MLAKYRENRQRQRIGWDSDHGPEKIAEAICGMFRKIAAAEQSPFQ